jgi:hypothetical protein
MTKQLKNLKNNGMKIVVDTTYERMLTLNIPNKEKNKYLSIWKQIMNKCKKYTK